MPTLKLPVPRLTPPSLVGLEEGGGEVTPAAELRGATIDDAQLTQLAPTIAVELGIDVR